jgi:hypothetical protein
MIVASGRRALGGPIPNQEPAPLRVAQFSPVAPREPRGLPRTAHLAGFATTVLRGGRARVTRFSVDVRHAIGSLARHTRPRWSIGVALAVAGCAFLWFGWPTPYHSLPLPASGARIGEGFDVLALRQQRLTGRVDALISGGGWVCVVGCGVDPAPIAANAAK